MNHLSEAGVLSSVTNYNRLLTYLMHTRPHLTFCDCYLQSQGSSHLVMVITFIRTLDDFLSIPEEHIQPQHLINLFCKLQAMIFQLTNAQSLQRFI